MQIITGITSAPKQAISIPLPDGSNVSLNLTFVPQQKGWFYDIGYSTRTVNFLVEGRRLVTSPNLLRQFQDVIPFGMAVIMNGNIEPTRQTDFSDGSITFLLLDPFDIQLIEDDIYTGSSRDQQYGFTVGPVPIPDVLVSTFDKSITSGMASLYGFSGYRPTGNTQDDDDPTAPWNSGPILKWRNRTLAGSMEMKDGACNVSCATVGGNFRSISYFSGNNIIDTSGSLTQDGESNRYDSDAGTCDSPTVFTANHSILSIDQDGWVMQAVSIGGSTPIKSLTSNSIVGLECVFNETTSRYYGTASEIIDTPDTVEAAINRSSFVSGSGQCTYTSLAGTNTPEDYSPLPLGNCASLSIQINLSGGLPLSLVTVRLNFENTVISTSAILPPSYIDVTMVINYLGNASASIDVPQAIPDVNTCYTGNELL